ncbi:hypothetical protein U9M48_022991 [Paspalum notatum var. saurae]|uniref:Uncharacterized protein n=1 Tax=Paspalum notatum var. saurae TaxID=547442 RepID=A0AAQ3TNH7_PASNO
MADSQVVEGMRKAYAEIMLNMAQESAARVLAAERRAAALAAGLEAAKEDGVAALVRLKSIMDARIKEKELESSALVKKLKELEDQLHGAQNAMASLKVELQGANTELELTRETLANERINSFPTSNKVYSSKNTSPRSKVHQEGDDILLKNEQTADNSDNTCLVPVTTKANEAVENLESMYRRSPDLPSFMERNKKPKFYHSGCTQRIHALKQRTQSTDASLKENRKQVSALNSRSKTRRNNAAKKPCHTRSIMEQILQTEFSGNYKRKRGTRSRPSYKHESSSEHGEAEYKLCGKSESDGNGCLLLLQALEQDLSPPKASGHGEQALTNLKEDLSRRDAELNRCTAFPQLTDVLAVNNMQMKRRKRTRTVRVLDVGFSDCKSVPESANTLLRTASEKSMSDNELISEMTENHFDTPARNGGPFSKCATENLAHETDADNGLDPENSSTVLLHSTKSETIEYGNLVLDQLEQPTPDNNTASLKEVDDDGGQAHRTDASTVSSLDKEENLKASSGPPMQALEKPDASVDSSLNKEENAESSSRASTQALVKPDASSGSSLNKEHTLASPGASMQTESARHIKYTFNRRKRKCVSIDSTPQRAVPKEGSDLGSPTNKQKPHPDPVIQDHLIDCSQGDSQLVQVAQQLILLSYLK